MIKQSSKIALLFAILALFTSSLLVISAPNWLNWTFAIFWFGTGLLGLYVALRNMIKK